MYVQCTGGGRSSTWGCGGKLGHTWSEMPGRQAGCLDVAVCILRSRSIGRKLEGGWAEKFSEYLFWRSGWWGGRFVRSAFDLLPPQPSSTNTKAHNRACEICMPHVCCGSDKKRCLRERVSRSARSALAWPSLPSTIDTHPPTPTTI